MAKGENIFKRKDGRWEARYVKEYDYTGKIKYGYCYGKTYREAKEKAAQHKAAILNGTPIVSSRVRQKFSVYCDQWLNANKTRLKISTINKYESIFNKYIKIQLGHMDPAKFSNRTIEGFTNFLLETHHLSAKTVKDILIILQAVIKYTSKQLPGCMASIDFVFPKEEKKKYEYLLLMSKID
ncbi:MAG: phage integrase SAM-like domain-containing protein [Erysipelotrichaceae bacterium]|nr:phage integrase SAM-like domain-containing protein [Erysipelotrichaceae bacterium]